jgi:indolepyruvate ferredoxin oxidoreductase alpha subunit
MSLIKTDAPGRKLLLMGNEAIARGALEAGVQVCAAYPGNPSSEIIGSLSQVADELNIYVEWSVNEKVALEVAAAASLAGLRGLAAMKQNGLNVASDFLLNLNLTGTKGGLVVVVCDDPSALSSSNEEDSRAFARLADLPLLEPSGFQEAKEMTRWAFELSEELGLPCLIRSVTRVSHARGNVELGELPREKRLARFDTSKPILPVPVIWTHKLLHEKLQKCKERFEASSFNLYRGPQRPQLLILTSGAGWMYALEAVSNLGLEDRVGIAKLGTTWPLPEGFLKEQLAKSQKVLFVEEVDPFLEANVKAFAAQMQQEIGPKLFLGKGSGTLPDIGELTPDHLIKLLKEELQVSYEPRPTSYIQEALEAASQAAPARTLGFCAGCPHRATYWAVKKALALDGRDGFVLGDIGCYSLGMGPAGFFQMKTLHAMGSGAGLANGFGQLGRFGLDQPVLAVCGDSTFYHAAIPALVNARYNGADFLMLILDNSATAMTGFQPHPGTGKTAMGGTVNPIDIEGLCKALGAEVHTVDPFELDQTVEILSGLLQEKKGVRVLVLRQECALVRGKRQGRLFKVWVDQDRCLGLRCGCNRLCTRVFRCPGLVWDGSSGKARVDEAICTGCGVCASICPASAILKEAS